MVMPTMTEILELREISIVSTTGECLTLFVALTAGEAENFRASPPPTMAAYQHRIVHTIKGDTPTLGDIDAATAAYRHLYARGP